MNDVVLRHITEHRSELIQISVKVGVIDQYLSIVGRLESAQRPKECRFSRAARAKYPDELAGFRYERHVLENQVSSRRPVKSGRNYFPDRDAKDAVPPEIGLRV